ncbi:citrate lyase holo-[acyl-carrier protein] synthase [Lachnospiraceae bacterium OttesenSCG-928-D06]|nr:citrate lyase holo-[acyl-carrier protein] synthase [Lachnospiraceae bacterium OttesenSCG-928-D06]
MENWEVTMMEVLDFRERKANVQKDMYVGHSDKTVVSLGMNIPGPVKSGSSVYLAFCEGKMILQEAIKSESGRIVKEQVFEEKAGYAAIYLVQGIQRDQMKKITTLLEETHPLGRLFDMDVLKENSESLSRTGIGATPRKCLLCHGDAKVCGRSRAHKIQELQEKTASIIQEWEKGREAL